MKNGERSMKNPATITMRRSDLAVLAEAVKRKAARVGMAVPFNSAGAGGRGAALMRALNAIDVAEREAQVRDAKEVGR